MIDNRAMRINLPAAFPLASLLLAGCAGDEGPALTASPAHGALFGHYDVTFSGDLAQLGDISSVTVGGIHAYALRPESDTLTVTLQGAPEPGPADVVVDGASGRAVRHGLFTFDPPPAGVPLGWLAFGASLTQGTESLGVNSHSQLHAVSGVIARQAGVFLALPLFTDGMLPGLQVSDFAPDCTTTKSQDNFLNGLVAALTDPQTQLIDLRRGRIDPTLTARNLAIGGSKLSDVVQGGTGTIALLEHIVEEPDIAPGKILEQLDVSQLDRIEKLDPDVGFSTDLLANDVDPAVVAADDLHPELITPVDTVEPLLGELTQRLGALHGQFFIANLPYLTFIPDVELLRAKRIAAGTDTAASFDAKVQQIDDLTDGYNAALTQAMAPYPNLHLVDFRGEVETIRSAGISVGGELCTVAHFGGLLSLDDLHFTDTGYALYANVLIDAIDQTLGAQIPRADVDAVHADDALAPSKLRTAGFTCVPPPM